MELRGYYLKQDPKKLKLNLKYDKKSKGRPAWIHVKGLPHGVNFIMIHLGKKGKGGRRIQFYKTYLPEGLFIPIDYTWKEMKEFYNKFSEIYDKELHSAKQNLNAAKFLAKKLKKYVKANAQILDLGAGTGIITEVFVDSGFKNITLLDYSEGMLNKSKKRKKLKHSKFILGDIRNLNLKTKFDVIISNFSLGSSTYFSEEEMAKIIELAKKHLKQRGIIALMGHSMLNLWESEFSKLESGIYTLNREYKFYTDYFIGRK